MAEEDFRRSAHMREWKKQSSERGMIPVFEQLGPPADLPHYQHHVFAVDYAIGSGVDCKLKYACWSGT